MIIDLAVLSVGNSDLIIDLLAVNIYYNVFRGHRELGNFILNAVYRDVIELISFNRIYGNRYFCAFSCRRC